MERCLKSLIIREIQIKTTMRFHFTLVRMALRKKSINNKCWRQCEEKGTLLHLGGDVNWCRHYGKQYGGALKKPKNRVTIWSSSPTPGYISRKNSNLKRYMNSNVHRSTIYKNQDMEAIEMFINRWIDKEDVLHIYNGILPLSHKKWNNVICGNMDGHRDNHN